MAIKHFAQSFAAILILAPSSQAFAGVRDCVPDTRRRARLVIQNNTSCDVAVYFGDHYVGECQSMTTLTLHTKQLGEIVATARSRCDNWGPITLRLQAGRTATWKIDHHADSSSAGRVAADSKRANNDNPESTHHLEQVLRRDEDEDRRDERDADNLRGDLHLDADGFAANFFQDQEQKQSAVHNW